MASADRFSLLKRKGGGGVVGQPLPTKREYPSGIGTLPIPAKHNNTRAGRPIPSEHQGFGHSLLLLIGSGANINVFSPGFSSSNLLVYASHRCLYQGKPIHTSGLGVVNASWAGTLRWSDSVAACRNGAWASAIRVAARVLASELCPCVLVPECPPPWEVVHLNSRLLLPGGRHLWRAACLGEPRVWASDAGQQVHDSRPLPSSFPCLS